MTPCLTCRPRPGSWLGLLVILASAATAGRGQESPPGGFDRWSKLEASEELRDYRNDLREGVFDDSARNFLTKIALPQLGLEGNRADIDRVRRKMFDRLCVVDQGGDGKTAALEGAMQTVTDVMTATARDGKASPVLRVNAMLLVGELRGPGAKPWNRAVKPLVAALGDGALPAAVRIAAAAGLGRHVEAEPEALAKDVGPALVAIVGSPFSDVDPAAADWLRSRALDMLATMGPAAPEPAVAAAMKLMLDAKRPIDVRVRAAAVVGRCTKAQGGTDVAAAVAAIRDLAGGLLEATKSQMARRELSARLSGGGAVDMRPPPGFGVPGGEPGRQGGEIQVYRRDAWRLATLADALDSGEGTVGLAQAAGPSAESVRALAAALRAGAERLDDEPGAAALDAALAGIAAAAATPEPAGGKPAATVPAAAQPAAEDDVPFGDR